MDDPLGRGNFVEWADYIHHRISFDQNQTVEEVHREMLALGIDFAAEVDEENVPLGLVSFKILSAALSARYGQALFAKKKLGETRVPGAVLGPMTNMPPDKQCHVVIPMAQVTVFNSVFDFFAAQARLERRPVDHGFDDIIVTSENGGRMRA